MTAGPSAADGTTIPAEADGKWILLLGPTTAPLRAASRPQTVTEVVAMVGEDPMQWAVELGHRMATRIIEEMPAFGGSDAAYETLRMGTESATLRSMMLLLSNDPARIGATEEALEGDRDFVRRNVPLDQVLRGIRLGHSLMAHGFLEGASALVDEPHRAAEMKRTSELLFEYIDDFASSMASEYLAERDRWVTSAAAEREELVRAILDERHFSASSTSDVLGYPLERHHLGLILWREASMERSPVDLQRAASRMLGALDCSATLLVPNGASSLWAWGARRAGFETLPSATDSPTVDDIHVAHGTPAQGIAGFRQSHLEASRAERLTRAAPAVGAPRLVSYNSVELASLLSHDLEMAHLFVARELGPLAEDTLSAKELRDTLSVYLSSERSLVRAGELLHIARNTVAYRVKKIENLTGRDLRERTLELSCALRLAETLGSRLLAAP